MGCRRIGETASNHLSHLIKEGIPRFQTIAAVKRRKMDQIDKHRYPLSQSTLRFLLFKKGLHIPVKSMGSQKAGSSISLQCVMAHGALHQTHHPQGSSLLVHRRAENAFNPNEMTGSGPAGKTPEIVICLLFTALIQISHRAELLCGHKISEITMGKVHELLLRGAFKNAKSLRIHRQNLLLRIPGNETDPSRKIVQIFQYTLIPVHKLTFLPFYGKDIET